MGLKEDRIDDEWARHYDILLWTVTSIFLALDGALLVYCSDRAKFRTSLAFGGILFNGLAVRIVASMRELRHLVKSTIDKDKDLSSRRKLGQWWPFISIFVLIALGWTLLLLENTRFWLDNIHGWLKNNYDCVCWLLVGLGVLSAIFIVGLGVRYRRPHAMRPPAQPLL